MGDQLEVVGNPDECWRKVGAVALVCQGAVVIAAPHADAVAVGVEGDQRGEEQVELAGVNVADADGFGDAVVVLAQPGVRVDGRKAQPAAAPQYGYITAFARGEGVLQGEGKVQFAVVGEVEPDAPGLAPVAEPAQMREELFRRAFLLRRVEGAAALTHGLAEFVLGGHGVAAAEEPEKKAPPACAVQCPIALNQNVQGGRFGTALGSLLMAGLRTGNPYPLPACALRPKGFLKHHAHRRWLDTWYSR